MDVLGNIKSLLYRHDCVILPEFGGFVANYVPARVDYDRNIFSPPSKKISFNSQLTHNDGLLISSVSQTYGLGYKNARIKVDAFTREMKNKLEKGKKITLEGLGTLFPGKDHTVQFEPDPSVNYLVQSYGLSTFEFDLLEEFDVRKKIQSKFNPASPRVRKRRKTLVRTTIIAIPILVALTLIPLRTNWFRTPFNVSSLNPFRNTEQPATLPSEQQSALAIADAEPNISEGTSEPDGERNGSERSTVPVIDDTDALPAQEIPARSDATQDLGYSVIVGSFKNHNNAIRLKNDLRAEGYRSELYEISSGFVRVSLESYDSYDAARMAGRDYQKDHPAINYWILQK
jgi:nucleoid DNA-binding protein